MSDDIIVYDTTKALVNRSTIQVYSCSGQALADFIEDIENPIGVEIGLAEGFTTEYLLESHENLIMYCIDPFVNYVDWNGNNLNEREDVYRQFLERTDRYKDRIRLIRKTSDDAAKEILDNSVDFVFIDGLHTYDQVTKDMTNYYSKVKNGGILSGHDYNIITEVKRAVNEFASKQNKEVLEEANDVWYWYK